MHLSRYLRRYIQGDLINPTHSNLGTVPTIYRTNPMNGDNIVSLIQNGYKNLTLNVKIIKFILKYFTI